MNIIIAYLFKNGLKKNILRLQLFGNHEKI
jgi:hypothetical protein